MLPGVHPSEEGAEDQNDATEGSTGNPSGGNTVQTDLIRIQLAQAPPEACPPCGLHPLSPGARPQQSSRGSKRRRRRRRKESGSPQPTASPAGGCFQTLLACLSCQASALLLGLLEACSSCCHACARCCSAVQEVPAEELSCHPHCHSVLFESCCEPTECLEFCLECCDICHRS
ncbi:myoD family inhibitor domain-containing protein-like [Brachionichthys hirsutus]|uniref:myoD family inhibitor domain-containing protein-like n=1 Tax=Brachionichthys hirsutus TaxID=412623 RepID=UPI0036049CCA